MKVARMLELARLHAGGKRKVLRCAHERSVEETCELTLVGKTGEECTYLCCGECAADALKNLPKVPEA